VPCSYLLIDRLIATLGREYLGNVMFWNRWDRLRKLGQFAMQRQPQPNSRARWPPISKWLTVLGSLALTFGPTAQAAQPVLQRGYDAGVSGAILAETTLNTSNVAPNTFGLVFNLPLDDSVLAQPLYAPNVVIPDQGTHNVVYIATMSDTLYAFDADAGGLALWSVNFASLVGAMPVPIAKFVFAGNKNIVGNLGILSTPVIDPSTNILYLIACTLESNTLAYRLHAVDITTGSEPYGPGVLLSGSYGGARFDARYQLQRVSLALSGNQVVFGFGPIEEEDSNNGYTGWVMTYNKLTLQQSGVFATQATGKPGAGVWQSGRPPVVDSSGYVYVFTANAYGDGYDGVNNFSESALKLDPASGLKLVDWFTAGDWSYLDDNDLDLSSSGPLLIPGTSLLAGGGKIGELYVLNTADLGKYNANDSQIVQEENITDGGEIHGGPVYWQRSAANGGPLLYNWGASDSVKAYAFNGTQFAASPSAQGSGSQIWPGGILALSANGEQPGSGVLWATVATSGDAENNPPVPGALHAFDAGNVANELWNSTMNASRDGFGNFAKFVPPLVANGKVYVATWSKQIAVYGLLLTYTLSPTSLAFGSQTTNVASAPMAVTLTNTGTVTLPITSITLSTASPSPFSQTNSCGTSLAVGASCTVSVVFDPTSAGSATATLSVTAGGSTATVNLSGMGSFRVVLTANSKSVTVGVAVSLSWSSTAGATCTASGGISGDNWTGPLAASGSQSVSETSTGNYTYVLTCIAQGVSATAAVTVAVTLPSVTLSATPTSITVGQSVTLTWASDNAATCVASGGQAGDGWAIARSLNGTATVTPNAAGTITYTLTCSSGPKSVQSIARVIATSPPKSEGGGGALDPISLLSLLTMIGFGRLAQRRLPGCG
jgi:hypothetical protein